MILLFCLYQHDVQLMLQQLVQDPIDKLKEENKKKKRNFFVLTKM
jgi:hypothetical protein